MCQPSAAHSRESPSAIWPVGIPRLGARTPCAGWQYLLERPGARWRAVQRAYPGATNKAKVMTVTLDQGRLAWVREEGGSSHSMAEEDAAANRASYTARIEQALWSSDPDR